MTGQASVPTLSGCHARANLIRTIAALDPRPGDHVLQLACGKGLGIELMIPLVPEGTITGVDCSALHVAEARSRNHSALASEQALIEQVQPGPLPFEADTFDAIFAVETAECQAGLALHLGEIARVLLPGGRIVLASQPDAVGAATKAVVANLAIAGLERIAIAVMRDDRSLILIAARKPECAALADPWPMLRLAG
jgi:ubiquinone/menaquinone biosynthesis C-methylase UbiE